LELRELKRARLITTELERRDPKNLDVIILRAVLDADELGQVAEAAETIERVKSRSNAGKPFTYGGAYATQLLDLRRYEEAEDAAVAAAAAQTAWERAALGEYPLQTVRSIRRYSRSTVSLDARVQDSDEGQAFRAEGLASMPFNSARSRLGVDAAYTDFNLDAPIPGGSQDGYHQAWLTARHEFNQHLHAGAALGSVDGDVAYRASLGWSRPSQSGSAELVFSDGGRPDDSLLLESLEAEERRLGVAASFEIPSARRFRLKADGYVREVEVDQLGLGDLGEGWGLRAELEYLLYQMRRTSVTIAYVGAYEEFDFESAAAARAAALGVNPLNLIEDEFHSHGLVVRGRRWLRKDLEAHGSIGGDYRFDSESAVLSLGAGLEYWFHDFARLLLDANYYSSGTAGNEDAGFFEGRVGLDLTF
ncbi:MAG: hypothetical protein HKO57_02720, partial [Akkermansiaceae bacterium]|nr:hypothetical protein [Akkermansiaceae bacterium]